MFCLESAAVLSGMPLFGEPRDIHIFDARRTRSLRFGDVAVHTSVDPRLAVTLDGVNLTSPADTAVDLGRVLPPAFALASMDAALRGAGEFDPVTLDELIRLADRQRNPRGKRRLAWALERADARSESTAESVSRAVIEWLGFPPPEPQASFPHRGGTDRTDFFWREHRIIGEVDGYEKYALGDPSVAARALIAEKRREDRLRRVTSGFARWGWSDAVNAAPLREVLLTAGLPIVRSPQTSALASLRRNPRSLPLPR